MFEHYQGPVELRDWAKIEARVLAHHEAERAKAKALDSARKTAQYFAGAAWLLFALLIWTWMRPAPVAARCPASGVMQLDPTTVRARATESIEI
jgi:hypothetical protein